MISTPSSSSGLKSKEFSYILKRVQQIRDQVEQPYITKMMAVVKHHIESDFSEQEEQCTNLLDCKNLLLKMFEVYKEHNKVTLTTHDDSELLNISTDSRSLRKPYGYKDSIFDQYTSLIDNLHGQALEKCKETTSINLSQKHEKYVESLTSEIYEKFESDKKDMRDAFKVELENQLKVKEAKIKTDFDLKRKQMYEDFEKLKTQFTEQFSQQTSEYQSVAHQDLKKQKEEFEKQKQVYETQYEQKVQRKTQLLEGMFDKRKAELEDEVNLKIQKLEYEYQNMANSQDSKHKQELDVLVSKIETQSQEKIKRIESETQSKIDEFQDQIKTKEDKLKKLKSEHAKQLKEQKKVIDREIKFKSDNLEKEFQMKIDREIKKYNETVEDYEQKLKELNEKLTVEKKKQKELIKANNEKHKAELNNVTSNHSNELIRKEFEYKRKLKNVEMELEDLKKEQEVELLEKLAEQKKELKGTHTQELKLEKSKHQKALLDKETELNKKLQERETELAQQHELDIENIKNTLVEKHNKQLSSAIENAKLEVKEQYRTELDQEVNTTAERIKHKYETENEQLKVKLQQLSYCQNNDTSDENIQQTIKKEDESMQTDEVSIASEIDFKPHKTNQTLGHGAYDYDNFAMRIEVGTQCASDVARISLKAAKSDQEVVQAIHLQHMQEMNKLQNLYELKITELLENHMAEIDETKRVSIMTTVKKLERIFVLEFDKICYTKTNSSSQPLNSESTNQIISELINDITPDPKCVVSIENIKKKLNEVLLKYKKKVDSGAKEFKTKLQREYIKKCAKLEARPSDFEQDNEISETPSVLDTGEDHGISPEKRIRKSVQRHFADFTKEFKL